jgi:hypothetical protein
VGGPAELKLRVIVVAEKWINGLFLRAVSRPNPHGEQRVLIAGDS